MTPEELERVRRYVKRLDRARATLREELEDEVAPVRLLSMRERGQWIAELCASAWAILRARPDFSAVIGLTEPPAPDFAARWRQLNRRLEATRAPQE